MPLSIRSGIIQAPSVNSFFTNFSDAPENPISEGGVWLKPSNLNANLRTVTGPNRVIGTQVGDGSFTDSYAQLHGLGFGPNVSLRATVYKDLSLPNSNGQYEVELHHRFASSGTSVVGYEASVSCGGFYSQIVRWDNPGSNFTFLALNGSFTAPQTGDVLGSRIIGSNISLYIIYAVANGGNGVTETLLASATDSTYASGDPGMGMWLNTAPASDQLLYGFTDFTAIGI